MDSSPEQRDAALSHERAHCNSGDNLKRFLILLAPDAVPMWGTFHGLERAWSKFTEWAADDEASAGDPQRALSLASALVRVAKMGSKPRLNYLSCSLVGGDRELSERVDRLLRPQPKPGKPVQGSGSHPWQRERSGGFCGGCSDHLAGQPVAGPPGAGTPGPLTTVEQPRESLY